MRAYIFPGQGIQKKGMGEDLFSQFPELTNLASEVLGYSIIDLCLNDRDTNLNSTEYSQPAIYVVNSLSYLNRLQETQVKPNYLMGHSLGEYNALFAAGAFDFITGLKLVKKRGELMSQPKGGGMAVVSGLSVDAVNKILIKCRLENVTIANYNSPTQVVISGDRKNIQKVKSTFEEIDDVNLFLELNTSGAFHSKAMTAARVEFHEYLKNFTFSDLSIPVISNVTARCYENQDTINLLARQIDNPVKWVDCVEYLLSLGVNSFEEIGESTVLTSLVNKIKENFSLDDFKKLNSFDVKSTLSFKEEAASSKKPLLLDKILDNCQNYSNKNLQIFHTDNNIEKIKGGDLSSNVRRLGSAFISIFKNKYRIVLILPQGAQFTTSLLACWYANCVVIPTPLTDISQLSHKKSMLDAILKSCDANYIVTNCIFESQIEQWQNQYNVSVINLDKLSESSEEKLVPARYVEPENLALVLYTSGSTSQPKGVMLSHNALLHTASSSLWGLSQESRVVSWLPQFHAFGISFGLLAPLVHGALNIIDSPEHFIEKPHIWFQHINKYQATHTGAPNFAFNYCYLSISNSDLNNISLSSLQSLICGGDIIHKKSYDKFLKRFIDIGLGENVLTPNYGLSEAGPISLKSKGQPVISINLCRKSLEKQHVKITNSKQGKCILSSGEVDDATEIVIVNPDSSEVCPHDVVGEIWLKSPCQGKGYLNDNKTTNDVFDARINKDGVGGYLRTGDLGFMFDSQLYIVGREKDLAIINGKNYHFSDIELSLKDEFEEQVLTNVVFSYDVDDIEKIILIQEVDDNLNESDYNSIKAKAISVFSEKHQLEVYQILIVNKGVIPITGSKKVRRKTIKKQFLNNEITYIWRYCQDKELHQDPSFKLDGIISIDSGFIKNKILYPLLGSRVDLLKDEEPLSSMGIDSISYILISRTIEEYFNVKFKPGMLFKYDNCKKLEDYLKISGTLSMPVSDHASSNWLDYQDKSLIETLRQWSLGHITTARTIDLIKERI